MVLREQAEHMDAPDRYSSPQKMLLHRRGRPHMRTGRCERGGGGQREGRSYVAEVKARRGARFTAQLEKAANDAAVLAPWLVNEAA